MPPTYDGECPKCKERFEYFCKISERESALPDCPTCKTDDGGPVKTVPAFSGNPDGAFILKGRGWFKSGGY